MTRPAQPAPYPGDTGGLLLASAPLTAGAEVVNPKSLTFPVANFDGTPAIGRVTLTAPKDVVHLPTGRQYVSGTLVRRITDGAATFDGLLPCDAPGLSRYDWTYTARIETVGDIDGPTVFGVVLLNDSPDAVNAGDLIPIPTDQGIPVTTMLTAAFNAWAETLGAESPTGSLVGFALVDYGHAA